VFTESVAIPFSIYSDHQAEPTGAAGRDPSDGILHHHGTGGWDAQQLASFEKGVGGGFARKMKLTGDQAIHPSLK
jgi:hypothetical protein